MGAHVRQPLSRRRILRSALRLIDRDGLEALSMRRLGAALGVEAMSLYRHVPNKEAVLDGVVELLTEEIDVPLARGASSDSWPATMRRIVRSYRKLAHAHPNAFPLIALRPLTTPKAIARGEATIALLLEAGLDELRAVLVFRTLVSYANGYLLEELAGGVPHFTTSDPEGEFEWGLGAVLVGVQASDEGPPSGSHEPRLANRFR